MLKRDFLLVAGTAAISSLLTYFLSTAQTTPPEAPRLETMAARNDNAAHLDDSFGRAVHVEAGAQGSNAANAAQQDSLQPAGPGRSDKSTTQDPAIAFEKRQELRERFSSFSNNGSNADSGALNAKVENRFYLEEWNQEWAGSKESNIRALFETNENLGDVDPLQVTCRSKSCQVVLSATTQEQVRVLSGKFMQAATNGDVGMKDKIVAFFPDVSTGRLVFYLSENGNTDLFQ